MIIAAIYARRSKEQDNAEDETKSVNRQVENARVFATAKGWTVLDAHVYVDDGISGASSPARLRAKARMLAAITDAKTPPFSVLICQAADRFSRRDGDESFAELKTVAKAGVEVWFYSDGTRFQFGDFASNTLSFLKGEFAAEYRRAISVKTAEAMKRKAASGHATGGRCFGYRNVKVEKHVERRIDPAEAAVVRLIFDLCAKGAGYTRVAKMLNAESAPCPRPQQGRPWGWAPSTVRDVLHRDLYRGVLVWNRTRKRDVTGDIKPRHRAPAEWLRTAREDLRIVTDAEWEAAHVRLQQARVTMTTAIGRRRAVVRRDYESTYLLTGHVRCATCGGAIAVVSRSHGQHRKFFYGCLAHAKRGVCPNDLVLPIARVDEAVLRAIGGDVLRPAVVGAIIDGVLAAIVPANVEGRVEELRRQLRTVDTKIQHLTTAIEQGGAALPSIIALLAARQTERDALVAEIASAEALHRIHVDRAAIEAKVFDAVGHWRELLRGSVAEARQMLREVLEAPLRFERDGRTYRFSAPVATGKLIAGAVGLDNGASPTGVVREWTRPVPGEVPAGSGSGKAA